MNAFVGTSGYSYAAWKGPFYPDKIKPAEMLRYYSGRLNTVEINNTFYRMPTDKMLHTWVEQVSDAFSFVLKAPRRITHSSQLKGAETGMPFLMEVTEPLRDRLGPMLFQFPPYFKKDTARLGEFLALLPENRRAAFEFRNASWREDDEAARLMRDRNVAWVVADTAKDPDPEIVATADFGYLRLRQEDYDEAALSSWRERVRAQPWTNVWAFFKHEDEAAGPRMAEQFKTLMA